MITQQEEKLFQTLKDEINSINYYLNLGIMDKNVVMGWFEAKEAYHKKMVSLLQEKYHLTRAKDINNNYNEENYC